ncbi:prepilin peptidase [Listeria cornellensis]
MLYLCPRSWRCIMIYFILTVYSLVLASFLHVVGMNYPLRKPFLRRISSECDYCGEKLLTIHLLPVVSFILLKGRTGCCNQSMSWSYFIVEILAPIFVCILYKVYGLENSFYLYIFIFSLLLILYVSDIFYLHIPNLILFLYFISCASYYGYVDFTLLLQHTYQLILGIIVFIGIYLFVRKGFGFGDIKLLILLCFFFEF